MISIHEELSSRCATCEMKMASEGFILRCTLESSGGVGSILKGLIKRISQQLGDRGKWKWICI